MNKLMFFILIIMMRSFAECSNCDRLKYYVECAVFETDLGSVTLTFFEDDAPSHTRNFIKLVSSGFYDGRSFHRVIADFVIQAGRDPSDPYSSLEPEIKRIHFKGALAAARMGNDINPAKRSDGHEFYISLKPLPDLDGEYTVFGRVADGFDTVKKIAGVKTDEFDRPENELRINKAYMDTFFDREKYEYYKRRPEQN